MNQALLKYAFTDEELIKHAGLFSILKLFGIKNIIKFIVSAIKKVVMWALTAYGVTSLSDIYYRVKEKPSEVFELGDDKNLWHIWRETEGPFENLFRIATYAMPAFAGLFGGSIILVLDKFLSKKYGTGFEDFGKWLDKKLNLYPGSKFNLDDNSLTDAISDIFSTKEKVEVDIKDLKKFFNI